MRFPLTKTLLGFRLLCAVLFCCLVGAKKEDQPQPFVKEIASGVFVRDLNGIYGSNQVFIIFDEYVVVFDGSVVDQGRILAEEIRSRTDKPVRYVIHSHFHPDHTVGAAYFAGEGVEILAGDFDRRGYEVWARNDFEKKKRKSPEQYRGLNYPAPTRYVQESEVIDDGQQRLEVIHVGFGHTKGDVVGWLPRHGILLTGDLCENQQVYNLGSANIAGWIKILDRLMGMHAKTIVPGHGHVGGPELLMMTRRCFVEMRSSIADMVAQGMDHREVLRIVEVPVYEEWTGKAFRENSGNVTAVYREVGGVVTEPFFSRNWLAVGVRLGAVAAGIGLVCIWRKSQSRRKLDRPAELPQGSSLPI